MDPIKPDLSSRPHACSAEATLSLTPDAVYRAFTDEIDTWFAASGRASMRAAVNAPYFFETEMEGQYHAHYGRFLALRPGEHVQMTWMTGNPGTLGAETVVTIDIAPHEEGSRVTLSHAGFADKESCDGHAAAWPQVFAHLDNTLAGKD